MELILPDISSQTSAQRSGSGGPGGARAGSGLYADVPQTGTGGGHPPNTTGTDHTPPAGACGPFDIDVLAAHSVAAVVDADTEGPQASWEERTFQLPASIWLSTLEVAVARHIKLPRSALQGAPGSQHPTFTIANSPLALVRLKCEDAGLHQEGGTVTKGQRKVTVFKGSGPMTAFKFCSVQKMKALGHGSGALVAPRQSTGLVSEVLTLACPPITVRHVETRHEWKMEVDFYLGVYNDLDRFTLPQPANLIYGNDQEEVEEIFRQAARYVLGEMLVRGFPISQRFKELLPPEYSSGESELEESESEEES